MPAMTATTGLFTPRMAALANAALGASGVQTPDPLEANGVVPRTAGFLGSVLSAVENRTPLTAASLERAERWGMQGFYGRIAQMLQPHAEQLDEHERRSLLTLQLLDAVFPAVARPGVEQAHRTFDVSRASHPPCAPAA